jgi:hypothetical protein
MLSALDRLTPMQILEKYRLNFNIDEDQEGNPLANYKENIIDFQVFCKKMMSGTRATTYIMISSRSWETLTPSTRTSRRRRRP